MNNAIMMPTNGETTRVKILSGQALAFPFDVAAASVERVDNDLIFTLPEGNVAIEDFFALEGEALPSFSLADGSIVTGEALLTALGAEDLQTAAGPADAMPSSGGIFTDSASAAGIDGVNRLGALDTQDTPPLQPAPHLGETGFTPGIPDYTAGNTIGDVVGDATGNATGGAFGFGASQNAQETYQPTVATSAAGPSGPASITTTETVNEPAHEATQPTQPAQPGPEQPAQPGPEQPAQPGPEQPTQPGPEQPTPEQPAADATNYNMLFVVQLNTMDARLWNDGTAATADYGGYKTALSQVHNLLTDFCNELQGTGAGTVNFGAVMFAGANKNLRQIGPITFDADDAQSVTEAFAALQSQFDALMNRGFYDSGSNFEAAFEAATSYVQQNEDQWGNPDCQNKVMFISNGQASSSNFAANYDGEGKVSWLNKGNVTGDGMELLSTSNSISSTQHHKLTVNGQSTVIEHNEFQAAVDCFNNFVNTVESFGGTGVDVHALGLMPHYGNASIGQNVTQYQQEVLSFFDNTRNSMNTQESEGPAFWSGKSSSNGNLLTATGEQADTGFVHELSLIAKQLAATVAGNEYSARNITAGDVASGDYSVNDENGIYYLDGTLSTSFGDGDNIVYLGNGKSNIDLGDGDNYVNFVYYNGNTVTAGAGDNALHVNGTGNKITLSVGAEEGHGNDTLTITGDNNTIEAGAGDDLLFINSNGNILSLGEGSDTVVLDFKTATASGETVFINGSNTITDFKIGDDVLDISKIIDVVSEQSGQELTLESYLANYADAYMDGNNLHITFSHVDQVEGHRRGTGKDGEDWSYNYKIDDGGVTAQTEVVLQNFSVNNPGFDDGAMQTLMTIMNGY